MKRIAIAIVLSASLANAPPAEMEQRSYGEPAQPWTNVDSAKRGRACRDRIEQVRASTGRPTLDRWPASPDKPLLIYAVDKRLDDCSVLVPVADPSDLRQSPEPGEAVMLPAR